MIVIADDSKWVAALGRFPLPVEIAPFGAGATRLAVERALGISSEALTARKGKDGHAFVTDGGHLILDAALGRIDDPRAAALALGAVPGVMEHGLFLELAHMAVLGGPDGVRIVERR
jgi:ribose 5-phosphate isomerase A